MKKDRAIRGLCLSRKVGESIKIGDCWVTVVEIRNSGVVRLVIDAPREIQVMRTELLDPVHVGP